MLKKIQALYAYLLFYPTLFWTVLLGRVLNLRNWWDEVDDCIILGAIPFSGDVSKLKDLDVKCIINLCAEHRGPVHLYRKFDIDYYQLPVIDFICPGLEIIKKSVSIIEQYTKKDDKVYIHCKAGRGRSATIVFCWLVSKKHYDAQQAMNLLISKRHQVNRKLYKREVVKNYLGLNSN